MKAVIRSRFGTGFLLATKYRPKEMLPIYSKTPLQYLVNEEVSLGITDIIIITSRNKKFLKDHFDKSNELEHPAKSQKRQ